MAFLTGKNIRPESKRKNNNNNNNENIINNDKDNFFFFNVHIYFFIHGLKYNTIRESSLNKVRPFTTNQILLIMAKITCKPLGLNPSIFYYGDSICNTRYE